jgi:Ser/Thr protein kinase RdoA (MazF antagonist)
VATARALADIHGVGMTATARPDKDSLVAATHRRATSATAGATILAQTTGVGDQWRSELDSVLARLGTSDPWTTWLHGDPCPGNVIIQGDRAVLVDLESSAPGNAMLEAAYLRMAFPTCWCVGGISERVLADAEAAYRERLSSSCPVAADDEAWTTAMADACCYWALEGNALVQRAERGAADLIGRAIDKDWIWGTFTARKRLQLRLAEAARLAASAGDRPHLVTLLRSAAELDGLPIAPRTYPAL